MCTLALATRRRVRTFGCSHNVSDSEYMEGMLAEYGYDLVGWRHHLVVD